MSKRHQQTKEHSTNRVGTSVSVGPESPHEIDRQIGSLQTPNENGFVPTNEDIQKRAYQIHEERGGSELENWLEAERLLKEEQHVAHR